jgi:hypothetical protein
MTMHVLRFATTSTNPTGWKGEICLAKTLQLALFHHNIVTFGLGCSASWKISRRYHKTALNQPTGGVLSSIYCIVLSATCVSHVQLQPPLLHFVPTIARLSAAPRGNRPRLGGVVVPIGGAPQLDSAPSYTNPTQRHTRMVLHDFKAPSCRRSLLNTRVSRGTNLYEHWMEAPRHAGMVFRNA